MRTTDVDIVGPYARFTPLATAGVGAASVFFPWVRGRIGADAIEALGIDLPIIRWLAVGFAAVVLSASALIIVRDSLAARLVAAIAAASAATGASALMLTVSLLRFPVPSRLLPEPLEPYAPELRAAPGLWLFVLFMVATAVVTGWTIAKRSRDAPPADR